MSDEFPLLLGLVLVTVAGTCTVLVRDPVRQSFTMSVFGLALATLFLLLQAPDVALSQLAVGSALTPLMVLLSVRKVRRRGRGDRREERR
ncbi:hydrogenase subunit MbhD domain-containing protein [Streptomyces sp. NPDC002067]